MNPDPTSLAWWATNFGPTGVVVGLCGLAGWRILVWVGKRVDELLPLLKDLLVGHVRLMGVMEEHLTNGSITLKKVSDTQDRHGSKIDAIHSAIVKVN